MVEPDGLPSMGSRRVGHDWSDLAEGLIGLYRNSQLQLLLHQWLGIDLNYSDVEWFAFEMNWNHFVLFEIEPKYHISDSFVDYEGHFPSGLAGKQSAGNEGDLGLISELGRSPGEVKGYPLQSSGLGIPWIV